MLELDFQAYICEAFAEDKKQHYCEDLVWDVELIKKLFSTISEQDFNQNVGEVAYSIYVSEYWSIAQNEGTWLGNKDKIYIYPNFL